MASDISLYTVSLGSETGGSLCSRDDGKPWLTPPRGHLADLLTSIIGKAFSGGITKRHKEMRQNLKGTQKIEWGAEMFMASVCFWESLAMEIYESLERGDSNYRWKVTALSAGEVWWSIHGWQELQVVGHHSRWTALGFKARGACQDTSGQLWGHDLAF